MGKQETTLKLLPSRKKARDKAQFSKYMGSHHSAASSPFWFERLKEAKAKLRVKATRISDYHTRKVATYNLLFSGKRNGITYTMRNPIDSIHNFVLKYLPQYDMNLKKIQFFTQLSGINPRLGLTIEQLIAMELLGGSVTEQWTKRFIIWQNGGLNPHYGYGSFAFGYGEAGQIKRLSQQELCGKAPDIESKLLQDCESLGLTSILDEHHDDYKYTPSVAPNYCYS
tara:strand:+ start:22405 stop:23082 length:678 start_codon:yes stop_codon:yes gene_type:complete